MLPQKYNALESEKKWQDYWEETGLYKFDENAESIYSIDTPPPTVNGKIHVGHIFSYSQAEIIARYWRMKGCNVFYPFGFDDNGLPTERLVEKQFGIKAHEMSREEFTKLCLQTTAEFEEQFKKLFKSLGFSVDWSLEYSTINARSQKTSQKSFIDLYKSGKTYYSESPALWCTECRTSIAQAEIETKSLPSLFNHIKFRLAHSDEEIIIATTRPELLPACVCIFVNPEDIRNAGLIGKEAVVPIFDFNVPILSDQKVDMDKGSGIVMCCTFGDLTDLEWWKKFNLPLKRVITKEGRIAGSIPFYAGLKVDLARKRIIEDLKNKGYLIKSEAIDHNVAVHERCGHPIEITVTKQWFISILKDKDRFLEAGDKINWYPSFMKERYRNWVENIQWDWCISRQRYFGVPFPVWYCSRCGEITVAQENKLPVNPLTDKPERTCKCGNTEFTPEQDVMDTWATSSVTPLINANWIGEKNLLDRIMPMSLRPNAHDIIRTWDFYTIVKNIYHLGKIPWNNLMISGFVLAGKGEKISKSKDNAVDSPEELVKRYSADVVRYWAANGRLGSDIVFSQDELKNGSKLVTKLWNASRFALMHLQDFNNKDKYIELLPMDNWVLSKLAQVTNEFNSALQRYEIGLGLTSVEKFFWNFCDNYIEIVKSRLYKPDVFGDKARLSGQKAVYTSLLNILKLFAPYFPHVTEEIYQDYFKKREGLNSIHISRIDIDQLGFDLNLIEKGDMVVDLISKVRKHKSENNLSLRAEIKSLGIRAKADYLEFIKSVEYDLKSTCSCLNIDYILSGSEPEININ